MICPKCNTELNWWSLLLRHFDWGYSTYLYSIIGAFNTSLMITMKPNEIFELNLEKIGIPKEAKILQINYTPNGEGLFPIEIHGNTPVRHFIPNKILLFGRPLGEPKQKTKIAVNINWVEIENNELWNNLIEAVEAFSISKFKSAIIPANVAVEAKLNQILNKYLLSKDLSAKKINSFLTNGATYSYQLNILLPLLVNFEKFPILPDIIRGKLNTLKNYRNKIAHKGTFEKPVNKKEIGELLCSVFFALAYLDLLEKKINSEE